MVPNGTQRSRSPITLIGSSPSPLGLPTTLIRAPLRLRAPFAWLARGTRSRLSAIALEENTPDVILTGAVGLIMEAAQAEGVLQAGQADLIVMARQLLRDPYWPLLAAQALGDNVQPPVQYLRAF